MTQYDFNVHMAQKDMEIYKLRMELAECHGLLESANNEINQLKAARHTDGQEWFTTKQAVAFTGFSKSFFDQDRLSKKKRIPSYKPDGRNVRYLREDIEKFMKSSRSTTNRKG